MILAAGLSPAWQQTLRCLSLRQGEVNRVEHIGWSAAGKAVNVAAASAKLGAETVLLSCRGGETGRNLTAALQTEAGHLPLRCDWLDSSAQTRTCRTILEPDGVATELVENSPDLEPDLLPEFLQRWKRWSSEATVSVFSGSLPLNVPPGFLAEVVGSTPERCLVDLRGDALISCLPQRPFLIKPNREELQSTVKRPLETRDDLLSAMRELNSAGATWILVTDGPREAVLSGEGACWTFAPPAVNVVNPIGSGDCLAAGIAVGLDRGLDVPSAVRLGMGAAAANVESRLPAGIDRGRCAELAQLVTMESVY